jgi:hypothetical protein
MESFKLNVQTQLDSWSISSVVPKTAGLLFGPSAAHHLDEPGRLLVWLPAALYLCAVYFVIRRGVVPQWCWGPLALASVQMIVPLSFAYSAAWAPLAAVWYGWGHLIQVGPDSSAEIDDRTCVGLRVLLLLVLTVTLAPSVFTIAGSGGFVTPVATYLSPVLVLATLCAAIVQSLRTPADVPRPMAADEATALARH